jgi:hypothetical protein
VLPIPTQNFLSEDKMKDLVKNHEQVVEIKGNEMSKDVDTDSEEEQAIEV